MSPFECPRVVMHVLCRNIQETAARAPFMCETNDPGGVAENGAMIRPVDALTTVHSGRDGWEALRAGEWSRAKACFEAALGGRNSTPLAMMSTS